MLVIVGHIPYALNSPPFFHTANKYFNLANSGVQLFFVISGFLIGGLLLKEKVETGSINIKKFYLRRIIRICPAFFVYILVIILLKCVHVAHANNKDILVSSLFIADFGNVGRSWLVGHSWSLAVEQQFYLFWPLVFIFLPRKYIFLFAIVILYDLCYYVVRFYPLLFLFRGLFLSLPPVIFGILLSIALFKNWLKKIHHILMHPAWAFSLIIGIVIYFPRLYTPARFLRIPYDYIFSSLFLTAFLYYAIHCNIKNPVYKILNNRIVVYLGLLSYSIYLWQQIFFAPAYNFTVYPSWTIFPLNIILAVATAFLSYNLIEKPFLRLKAQLK